MKKNVLMIVGFSLLASLSHTALAEHEASVSLGYVATTGNTETRTYNTELLLTILTTNWTHNMKFQGLGSSEDDMTTAERYYLEDKSDYNLDETQYLYGKGSYNRDRFSGFDSQSSVSAGYGRHFYTTDSLTIQGYGGLGYSMNDVQGFPSEDEAIIALGESLEWTLSENSSITQSFDTEVGDTLTVTRFEVGLESVIVGSIATKISFQARHNSEVPPGVDNTDTQTSVSLVYEF